MTYAFQPIAHIRTCFPQKFGIPRQSLLAPSAKGWIEFESEFNDPDCVAGLEQVSHLWLSFIFHQHYSPNPDEKNWKSKVRPPRLGGNKKMGVFATRSSFRPNPIGLSVVKLDAIDTYNEQLRLEVSGVDLLDNTPIIDIKPYVSYSDSINSAVNVFANQAPKHWSVQFSDQALSFCQSYGVKNNVSLQSLIIEVLQQDPRPAYHEKEMETPREYGLALMDCNVRWVVGKSDQIIEVLSIGKNKKGP